MLKVEITCCLLSSTGSSAPLRRVIEDLNTKEIKQAHSWFHLQSHSFWTPEFHHLQIINFLFFFNNKSGDTRWSSHLKSISSLMRMFSATCEVLLNIIEDGTTPTHRGDADAAYENHNHGVFIPLDLDTQEVEEVNCYHVF
ncbi:uncharacterized protein LOC115998117 [Ipomoea triloba]|uniref:uncharacterized protein LOC115998117 n=1 Tax=Ipomoea triloba TaxID=35885 RepID=UPI00125E09C4|nr:uncharacterized protein LOC115998117 [Ipomoea triloba]